MGPLPYQWCHPWSARENKNKPLPFVRTYSPFSACTHSLPPSLLSSFFFFLSRSSLFLSFVRSFSVLSFPFASDSLVKSMLAMHMVVVVVVVVNKDSWQKAGPLLYMLESARVAPPVIRIIRKALIKFIITVSSAGLLYIQYRANGNISQPLLGIFKINDVD